MLDAIIAAAASLGEVAGLYTMFNDGRPLTPAISAVPTHVSRLGRLPLASTRLRRWLLPLYPRAVADLSSQLARHHASNPIQLLISTSSAAVKNITTPAGIPHLSYIHSPPRYLWHLTDEYKGGLRGLGLSLFKDRLRAWDARGTSGLTHILANSTHTAAQIQSCYDSTATVLHPPVRTDWFTPPSHSHVRGNHLLAVAALEPYKRIDLAIAIANAQSLPLRIAGRGSIEKQLRVLAGPTVTFLGRISDEQLRDEYRSARMLLFPQVEDFGIVAAEALSCGLPVVARNAGGALDMIEHGRNGALFNAPAADASTESLTRALAQAINECPGNTPETAAACRDSALRFSQDAFANRMHNEIQSLLARR